MDSPVYETLLVEQRGPVALVTLNRPDRLNAYNTTMMLELVAALDWADGEDAIGAVVITGAGRAFCAGADVSAGGQAFANLASDPTRDVLRHGELYRDGGGYAAMRIFDSKKPVIAAINGAAVGIGVTLTLPCDIRMASEEARFGFLFTKRGLVPEAASSWFLPRIVGISTALEWTMAARMVAARDALDAGLVRSLHASADLLPAAMELAEELATSASRVAVSLTRQMMWRMLGASSPMAAHRVDSRAILARRGAPDTAEGVQAFLDKRPPNFTEKVSDGLPDIWPDHADDSFY